MGWRDDRDKRIQYLREYYQKNKDKHREYSRARRKADPAATRAYTSKQTRSWIIRIKHGMTIEQYEGMLAKQNNCCAICFAKEPGTGKNWRIDHDHTTLRVRGLLCHHCNVALGLVRDNVETLKRMIDYLKR